MHRSYRGIILAFVGLILIGAAESPKLSAQSNQSSEQAEIAKSLREISATLKGAQESDQTTKPCDPEKPNRNSDLCAQWKAADAASQAVNAAWEQIRIGWIGIVLGGITMVAAIAAAVFARKAAVATRQHADIALAQADPYIRVGISLTISAEIRATVPQHIVIEAHNRGLAEARQVRIDSAIVTTSDGTINQLPLRHIKERDAVKDIPAQGSHSHFAITNDQFLFDIDAIKSGKFNHVELTLSLSFSYLKFSGGRHVEMGVWTGRLEPSMRASAPDEIETIRIGSFTRMS